MSNGTTIHVYAIGLHKSNAADEFEKAEDGITHCRDRLMILANNTWTGNPESGSNLSISSRLFSTAPGLLGRALVPMCRSTMSAGFSTNQL